MKKLLSALLTAVLALALSCPALAAGGGDKDAKVKAPKPVETKPGISDSEIWTRPELPSDTQEISKLQAEEAALSAAGVSRSMVKSITVYKEYSHGVPYAYHVGFGVYDPAARQTTVYHCQIDLHTGILTQETVYVH